MKDKICLLENQIVGRENKILIADEYLRRVLTAV